jgi:cytochrome P450
MSTTATIPDNVPPELVFEFDLYRSPELTQEPHKSVTDLFRSAPDIFWTPAEGGYWIVRRVKQALEMLANPSVFSSSMENNHFWRGRGIHAIPINADPPEHTAYRKVINPDFSPGAVAQMEGKIRSRAVALIDGVYASGQCEFVRDIAKRLPIDIFLGMVNAPLKDRDYLIELAEHSIRNPDSDLRIKNFLELAGYVRELAKKRRAEGGDDLLSSVIKSKVGDRPITEDEVVDLGVLLFLGGLDTVAAVMSFMAEYLARNPDKYQELRNDPGRIPAAVEELLRVRGVSVLERGASRDFEWHGLKFKQYDRFIFMVALYGLDDREFPEPFEVSFNRDVSRHLAFGAGPHRCAGSHLARAELRIFLEEWVKRFDAFQMAVETPVRTLAGTVWIPETLPLKWTPKAS